MLDAPRPLSDIGGIELVTLNGERLTFDQLRGRRATLVVNVASRCGFTPQYQGLEALHQRYRDAGLAVLGFPCNQFGAQEPGDESEIQRFCSLQYGVTFPLLAKVDVNGRRAHPLFRTLKVAAPGLLGLRDIRWNFTKFLIDHDALTVERFSPQCKPEKIGTRLQSVLGVPSLRRDVACA